MCETSAIVDHELVVAARHASDLILGRYLRVPVAKAMNLGIPRGFDRAVAELAAALRSRTAAPDADAARAADAERIYQLARIRETIECPVI